MDFLENQLNKYYFDTYLQYFSKINLKEKLINRTKNFEYFVVKQSVKSTHKEYILNEIKNIKNYHNNNKIILTRE